MTRTYVKRRLTRATFKGVTIFKCRGGYKIEGERKVYKTLTDLTDTL